jgi:general secretion pathway protein B
MSFILDALKKSENERQEQGPTEFANIPTGSDTPGVPRWLWVLGILLAVNLFVLVGLLLRNDTPEIAQPSAQPAPPQATESFARQLDEVRDSQPVVKSIPDPRPEPATSPRESAAPAAAPERTPAIEATQPPVPADVETTEARVSPAVEATQPGFTLRALPTVDELRANGTIGIAELHLDIHVYSESPPDRFVFINMTRHSEGSKLAEGPVVSEITPEGVILDYRGTVFLLPRE